MVGVRFAPPNNVTCPYSPLAIGDVLSVAHAGWSLWIGPFLLGAVGAGRFPLITPRPKFPRAVLHSRRRLVLQNRSAIILERVEKQHRTHTERGHTKEQIANTHSTTQTHAIQRSQINS